MATRPRGFIEGGYRPRTPQTRDLLAQVLVIFDEYRNQLPMTGRQIFYRLVGKYGYEKTEQAYSRLLEMLNLARRGKAIPFDWIRDDGASVMAPSLWESSEEYMAAVAREVRGLHLDPWPNQPRYVEVICEAGGMVPMLAAVANTYGITVRSSGGFDSTTVRYDLARHYAAQGTPTTVLHIGDHDASGEAVWQVLQEDVSAFCAELGGSLTVQRLAVTAEQVVAMGLPTAPPKPKDYRPKVFSSDITAQAEAIPPDTLQGLLHEAIEEVMDMNALAETREREAAVREDLVSRLPAA